MAVSEVPCSAADPDASSVTPDGATGEGATRKPQSAYADTQDEHRDTRDDERHDEAQVEVHLQRLRKLLGQKRGKRLLEVEIVTWEQLCDPKVGDARTTIRNARVTLDPALGREDTAKEEVDKKLRETRWPGPAYFILLSFSVVSGFAVIGLWLLRPSGYPRTCSMFHGS